MRESSCSTLGSRGGIELLIWTLLNLRNGQSVRYRRMCTNCVGASLRQQQPGGSPIEIVAWTEDQQGGPDKGAGNEA